MSTTEQIYYLRQSLRSTKRFTSFSDDVREVNLIAHFYVKAEDGTNAGGAAGMGKRWKVASQVRR
jgi:hypothetical protein